MKRLTLEADIETTDPQYDILFMNDCIEFWHREGFEIYVKNLEGILGTKETNEFAKKTKYEPWLLNSIKEDLLSFCSSREKYEAGQSGDHVWFHRDGERIAMVYVV